MYSIGRRRALPVDVALHDVPRLRFLARVFCVGVPTALTEWPHSDD